MSDTTRLEAEVWFRCPDTAELWRFAQWLPDPADGSDRVPPPEGRRNMVLTWVGPDDSEPWQAAFDNGIGQAGMLIEQAQAAGIDVHVYAVRVGPVDGEYLPQVEALSAGSDGETDT